MKLEQSIIIARPIATVFACRSALQRTAEWQPDVLAAELSTAGPVMLGTQGTERRRGPNDVALEWELEITEFKLNHVLGILSRCGSVQVHERDVFAPDGENTRYTAYLEVTGSPLPSSVLHRRIVEALMHLKWWLETPKSPTG